MSLPRGTPPWTKVTDKKNVGGRFPTLKACKNGFGDVTFVVRANNDLPKKVETHEIQHKTDYEAIFNSVVAPWNDKITEANKQNKRTAGINESVCENILYQTKVGQKQKPDEIIAKIVDDINTKAAAFHNTAAGAKPNISIIDVDPDCTVVKSKAS